MKDIIENTLQILSKNRPIFHSEADFQFALAWELKMQDSNIEIRMERPCRNNNKMDVDIIVINKKTNKSFGLELKYSTNELSYEINNEFFELVNQNMANLKRYDYYNDINRIETLISSNNIEKGYAIFLTNDLSFLKIIKGKSKVFNFSEGHIIESKEYEFSDKETAKSVGKHRLNMLQIKNTYSCKWNEYYCEKSIKNCNFKYIIIEVTK